MGSFKDAFEADVLLATTGQATTILTTTPFTHLWLSLFTVTPTDVALTGTEATGGAYARVDTIGKWGSPSGTTQIANNAAVNFTTFTGSVSSGAPFVAFALHTASSGTGNQIAWGPLTPANKTGASGDTMQFPIGSLIITAD